jgi:hypothetical protein
MAEKPPPNLAALPRDVLKHVVSFLDYRNALKFSLVNSWFRTTLSFSALHAPESLLRQSTWYGGRGEAGNTPRRSVWIPILFPHRTHSVVLTCQWNDQGSGNQKGALFVVAVPTDDDLNLNTLSSIEKGQLIYESPVAPHEKASLRISFNYSPSKSYFLWYRVGGGGGHQLLIENLAVHTVIFDHADKLLLRNYDALKSQNGVQTQSIFYLDLLHATAQSFLVQIENGHNADSHLVTLFESLGIQVTEARMNAMEELAMALIKMQSQEQARFLLPPSHSRVRVGRVPLVRGQRAVDEMNMDPPLGVYRNLFRAHPHAQRPHPVDVARRRAPRILHRADRMERDPNEVGM